MNKGIKTIALCLFIITCMVCAPVCAKEKKQKEKQQKTYTPRNSRIWFYNDNSKHYEKEKANYNTRSNIHEVSYYKKDVEMSDEDHEVLFNAPFARFRKFHNPDATQGINFIKRPSRDFE